MHHLYIFLLIIVHPRGRCNKFLYYSSREKSIGNYNNISFLIVRLLALVSDRRGRFRWSFNQFACNHVNAKDTLEFAAL